MSYDPSHRMPPRQERSLHATPAEGWPSYRDGDHADGQANGYGTANGYGEARNTGRHQPGGAPDDFDWGQYGHNRGRVGYVEPDHGYDWAMDGYAGAAEGFAGVRGGAHLGPGSYTEYTDPGFARPVLSDDPRLTAPDAGVYPDTWQAVQERRREASWRGPMVGAVTEVLATGVVIGVSTLAAGLLRSATSPISAMGAVFIDRTPATLRNLALQHFGTHGRTVLLLGMYLTFAVVAIAIGVAARRAAAVGVAGIAAFTLFAAFVTITRPAGHAGDAGPAVIGGVAGVAALLWLVRASAPAREVAPLRHGHGGTRRRTR